MPLFSLLLLLQFSILPRRYTLPSDDTILYNAMSLLQCRLHSSTETRGICCIISSVLVYFACFLLSFCFLIVHASCNTGVLLLLQVWDALLVAVVGYQYYTMDIGWGRLSYFLGCIACFMRVMVLKSLHCICAASIYLPLPLTHDVTWLCAFNSPARTFSTLFFNSLCHFQLVPLVHSGNKPLSLLFSVLCATFRYITWYWLCYKHIFIHLLTYLGLLTFMYLTTVNSLNIFFFVDTLRFTQSFQRV